jgi:hypothetical protein
MQLPRSHKPGIRPGRVSYLVVILLLMFQTVQFFPGMAAIQEVWYVFCFLYLVFGYTRLKSREHWKLDGFEWYLITIIAVVPIMSALCSRSEFGQPIAYGLVRERAIISIAAVLFCMTALRRRLFTLTEVKAALLTLAWGTAILWAFMRIALNPADYVNTANYIGFVGEGDEHRFVLQTQFIVFGVLYYALRGLRTGRARNYLLGLLLLAGAVDKVGGRQMILALLATFLFFAVLWTNLKRLLILLPAIAMGIGLIVGLLYFAMPQTVTERLGQFRDAFLVVFTGEAVEDSSATGRIGQVLIALDSIVERPAFGSGEISAQWEGGVQSAIGARFYGNDIGLIGAVYTYGFFGLVLYSGQYWFALRAVKNLPPASINPLLDSSKGFLLYTVLFSIGTGMFVFQAAESLFFVMLLRSMASKGRSEERTGEIKTQPLLSPRSAT